MALLDSDLTPCRGRKSWSGMEAVAGAWRTDSGEGTRPDIRTNHCYNSQRLHRHEQSYPCTDVTNQTQRLLLISVYPSDWVCFMPTCVRASVCVCVRAFQCVSICLCMCVCTHWRSRVRVHACVDPCAFASTVPSHFPSVNTCRCGRGRQNKVALARSLTRIQARRIP